jgi:hypothetical protein
MYLLPNSDTEFNVVGQIIQVIYSACSMILFLCIINAFFANKKQTIIDKIASVVLLSYRKEKEMIEKPAKKEKNYAKDLPGIIIPSDELE